ncbi:hypothetical protein BUALT_Bualt02G0221300 [Buddleja alternifolia]|uniref:Aluminum-activated malate transporter n=1 Tax=Buddleja alternifolia TaxID=168488 RepID=A0AAV6Y2B4_9LAMI|nr:hypothetical protein BUALT_Bualt02G0221300 [Buddleja alternifolia]
MKATANGSNILVHNGTIVSFLKDMKRATLGKGINRGIGTVIGGGLGCLAAIIGDEITGIGSTIIVACSVFIFGAGVTYCRLVPRLKKRYDYGFMISILTFNLVAVSGVRADKVVELARSRLATIGIGFAIWCLDDYFASEKENQAAVSGRCDYIKACKSILNSKSNDESLPPATQRQSMKEPCEKFMLSTRCILRELGECVEKMELCPIKILITPKLQSMKLQLTPPFSSYKIQVLESDENIAITSFKFLLMEVVEKVEALAKKVEELGELANFRAKKIDV